MDYAVGHLTTELIRAPLGIDERAPRFGWRIASSGRDVVQTGYRLRVCEGDTVVWDTGDVASGETQWTEYAGAPLKPRTAYTWQVISRHAGGEAQASSTFETGLMDAGLGAWRGARFIGDASQGLWANAKAIFSLTLHFMLKGEAAGIIFGKDDPRLLDKNKNDYNIAGEHYIKYRISRAGMLSIYRVGYHPSDTDAPIAEIPIPGFNPAHPHTLRIDVTGNNAYAYLDGARIDETRKELPPRMVRPGMPSFRIAPRQLNPAGDNDLTTYPMLATSGFFAEGVCEVIGFEIGNLRPPQATLVRVEAATPAPFDAHVRGDRLIICDEACTHDFSHGGIPLLNRTFTLEKPVRRARIYATARGIYELSLNGARVGERLFEPGASQYDRHLFYQTYDVTQALTIGKNAIDAALASGWWNEGQTFHLMNYNYWGDRQSLLLMLLIEYEDGAQEPIVTEPETWRVRNDGCVRFAGWFYGEHYDARRTGAPDWRGAVEVAAVDFSSLESEGGFMRWPVPTKDTPRIIASTGAPVAHIDTLTAVSMREPRPGVYVYDMGQNMVGVPQITMRGRSGEVAVLRYGEAIYPPLPEYGENAGMILTENYRDAISIDRYVFATDAPETYAPRFTFHGYRYIEITGVAEPPRIQDVQGNVFSSIAHDTGAFECANPLVNRLYQNIRWSQRGNFLSIPTDCPQRNERMGWAGDAQVFCRTAVYNADVYGFLRNYLLHTRDCQLPDGRFADIAPVGGGFGGIEWGSAGIIVAYELYRQYGDVRIIREHYAAMARYMEFLRGKGVPGLLDNVGPLSDWLATDMTTDSPLLWNAVYYHDAAIMGEMARAIGEDSDAQGYDALAAEIKENWNRAFVDPATGRTRALSGEINDTQASYAVPLAYGLFTDMQAAADHLARKTRALDHAVTTGFVGTAPLLPALTDGGYAADAYRALQNTRYPSWLYSVTEGATTIWERWNSVTREAGFGGNNAMNSFNHYSLGAVGAWMYEYALGIKRGRGSWRRFTLEPHIGDLDWARGHFETIYGEIRAEWAREGGQIVYRVRVPANTVADIKLPGGVRTVGSGEHTFTWR